jgi:T5SS/PEP-CTERM-associated repeat protein
MHQTQRQLSMMVLLMGTWAGIQPAAAQYTSNYQTNTISGVTSNWPGDYVVGSNTFADALLIRNRGALSNADGYVGYLPASNTNFVMVAGAGSVWTNAFMYFGYSGGGNTMVISNA